MSKTRHTWSPLIYVVCVFISDGMSHWEKNAELQKPEVKDDVVIWKPPQHQTKASAIENTAYAMLTYVTLDKVADAVPIMRWLVSQRNSLGGYGSTQVVTAAGLLYMILLFFGHVNLAEMT